MKNSIFFSFEGVFKRCRRASYPPIAQNLSCMQSLEISKFGDHFFYSKRCVNLAILYTSHPLSSLSTLADVGNYLTWLNLSKFVVKSEMVSN